MSTAVLSWSNLQLPASDGSLLWYSLLFPVSDSSPRLTCCVLLLMALSFLVYRALFVLDVERQSSALTSKADSSLKQ